MITVGCILFFVTLVIDLWVDYGKWKRGEKIDHPQEAGIREVILIFSALSFGDEMTAPVFFKIIYPLIMVNLVYWTLFDGLFNFIRRERWNFAGTDDPDDAKLDDLQQTYPWLWKAKLIGSAAMIALYIIQIL